MFLTRLCIPGVISLICWSSYILTVIVSIERNDRLITVQDPVYRIKSCCEKVLKMSIISQKSHLESVKVQLDLENCTLYSVICVLYKTKKILVQHVISSVEKLWPGRIFLFELDNGWFC